MLENVHIVLVEPKHPGNIGAAARAMKTMGLSKLDLVSPYDFPAEEADRRASGAEDLLLGAEIFDSLRSAVSGCRLVIGGTARTRSYSHAVLDARQAAAALVAQARRGDSVAAVFGTERTGLSNRDLDACNFELRIPTSGEFRSLNLASAVQLLAYEVFVAATAEAAPTAAVGEYPDAEGTAFFYDRLGRVLESRRYVEGDKRDPILLKLRRLIARARPDASELAMLHGLVTLMERDPEG